MQPLQARQQEGPGMSRHVIETAYRRDAPTGRTGMYRVRLVLTDQTTEF